MNELTQKCNIQNAKLLAFFALAMLTLYHGVLLMYYGSNTCPNLMHHGRFQGDHLWQPSGCMMHQYAPRDSQTCMRDISYWGGKNHMLFVGDTRISQLYLQYINMFDNNMLQYVSINITSPYLTASASHYNSKLDLLIEFVWHPKINLEYLSYLKTLSKKPQLLVTGLAMDEILQANGSAEAYTIYRDNITAVLSHLENLNNSISVVWTLQDPVFEKNFDRFSSYGMKTNLLNYHIWRFNLEAENVLSRSRVLVWSSARLITEGFGAYYSNDGFHVDPRVLIWKSQILLNFYCNARMNYYDGTCCATLEKITVLQIITGSFFGICIILATLVLLIRCHKLRNSVLRNKKPISKQDSGAEPLLEDSGSLVTPLTASDTDEYSQLDARAEVEVLPTTLPTPCEVCRDPADIVVNLGKLGCILAYFFICDRTNFFMKENKYYTHVNFFLPFLYLMILGCFFTEKSKMTEILNRDVTDEWKGWMQLTILLYHMTSAQQVLQIYMFIRLIVSAYLFLSGYGHFCYFWRTNDFSFNRFCKVLFRYNFLVVLLCFVMNRPYQFYHFVSLVSFWFVLIYLMLAMYPRVSSSSVDVNRYHILVLVLKVVLLFVISTLLNSYQTIFESIFLTQPLKALFVTTDDSLSRWKTQFTLDRYTPLFGVLFGLVTVLAKKWRLVHDTTDSRLCSPGLSLFTVVISISVLISNIIFNVLCNSRTDCNQIHTYICFLPIISYITLRNVSGSIRTRVSAFFSWFGKLSLELLIGQFHIFLAADTHGVLVLIPGYPVPNSVLSFFIFICAAHELRCITRFFSDCFVPTDWKATLRNIILFVTVLLPIAKVHGVL